MILDITIHPFLGPNILADELDLILFVIFNPINKILSILMSSDNTTAMVAEIRIKMLHEIESERKWDIVP